MTDKKSQNQPPRAPEPPFSTPQRLVVVGCAVLEDEVRHYAAAMGHIAHIHMLEQGLHNTPDILRQQLQLAIDHVEDAYHPDAIALVYGLCSRGTEGVRTRFARLAIARAQDCITHLLGDKDLYASYVRDHPGTYWYSPGWNKCHTPPGQQRYEKLYAQYLEKYGEDNAQYLMESEQHWFKTYDRAAYVDLTIGATDKDIAFTRECATWLGWKFDHQHGDPQLLIDLLAGKWDNNRFVVLQPGQTFTLVPDHRVLEITPTNAASEPYFRGRRCGFIAP